MDGYGELKLVEGVAVTLKSLFWIWPKSYEGVCCYLLGKKYLDFPKVMKESWLNFFASLLYFGCILDVSWMYFGCILDVSWMYFGCILVLPCINLTSTSHLPCINLTSTSHLRCINLASILLQFFHTHQYLSISINIHQYPSIYINNHSIIIQ